MSDVEAEPRRLNQSGRRLGDLPGAHRRWIMLNAIAATVVLNLVINGAIAWLTAAGTTRVPLWATPITGGPSTITDTVGTLFLLPMVTNLLVTTAIRRDLRAGRLTPLCLAHTRYSFLHVLPQARTPRGVGLGVSCAAILGPPVVAILIATDFGDVPVVQFVLYKAILAVALGALATPAIALRAMSEHLGPGQAPAQLGRSHL